MLRSAPQHNPGSAAPRTNGLKDWTTNSYLDHEIWSKALFFFKILWRTSRIWLANKHQFAVAYHWECLSLKAVESGPVKMCSLETLEFSKDITASLHVDSQATVNLTQWLKCCGVEYCVGLFVCMGTDENMTLFSKITIILHNGKVFFFFFFWLRMKRFSMITSMLFKWEKKKKKLPRKILVIEMERLRHFKSFDAQMSYGCFMLYQRVVLSDFLFKWVVHWKVVYDSN